MITLCEHHVWGGEDGAACTLVVDHPGGHVFRSGSGSEVDDRHRDGGHG